MNILDNNNYIYKYRSINNIERDLEMLINDKFYAATIEELNDPKECRFEAVISSELANLNKHFNVSTQKISERWRDLCVNIKQIGICSFSKSCLIDPMWSYYASGYTGYCLVYDKNDIMIADTPLNSSKRNLLVVQYEDNVPVVSIQDVSNRNLLLTKMTSCKNKDWEYEREVRIITDTPGKHKYHKAALVGVVFGQKMSDTNKNKIREALRGRNVTFYEKINGNAYENKLKEVGANRIESEIDKYNFEMKRHSNPAVDNFYVKCNFPVYDRQQIFEFINKFKKAYCLRDSNVFVYDRYFDLNSIKDLCGDYPNHEIATVYFGTNDVIINEKWFSKCDV